MRPRAAPILPLDRTDPTDPTDRNEPLEAMDNAEKELATLRQEKLRMDRSVEQIDAPGTLSGCPTP